LEKRNFICLAFTAAILMTAVSCSSKERLYIYNWTYYTPDSVIEKFEKEYHCRVVYDEFASNEDMHAKLSAAQGKSGYDVVFPSCYLISIMIQEDMLEKIDHSKMSNLKNIDPYVLSIASYDPDMEYSVPYFYGAAGIAVNTDKVPSFEKSWSIFAREDLKGRMTMLNDMREVMGDALTFLGSSVNTRDPFLISAATEHIINNWKPNLVKFDAEAFAKGYSNGDFWVVHAYPEAIFEEIADNPKMLADTVFFIPNEGGPSYIDNMVILKNAKNIDLAHKFIDFIHRPEIYAEFTDVFGLPATVNVPARKLKKTKASFEEIELIRTELVQDLGKDIGLYTDAWYSSIITGK